MEANKWASAGTTQTIHNEYSNVFTGIGCFKGTFSLQVKEDKTPCQVLPRPVVYALQEPLKKELERLQGN